MATARWSRELRHAPPTASKETAATGYLATEGLSAAIGGATAVWRVAEDRPDAR